MATNGIQGISTSEMLVSYGNYIFSLGLKGAVLQLRLCRPFKLKVMLLSYLSIRLMLLIYLAALDLGTQINFNQAVGHPGFVTSTKPVVWYK